MPLNDTTAQVLLMTGTVLVGANRLALRAKNTSLYKATYFLAWPVVGTGTMLAVQPDPEAHRQRLHREGHL